MNHNFLKGSLFRRDCGPTSNRCDLIHFFSAFQARQSGSSAGFYPSNHVPSARLARATSPLKLPPPQIFPTSPPRPTYLIRKAISLSVSLHQHHDPLSSRTSSLTVLRSQYIFFPKNNNTIKPLIIQYRHHGVSLASAAFNTTLNLINAHHMPRSWRRIS